uniref:Uncharacterized protein n=1 Tax=Amphimedon queenslandica TaxID=400682 RepID=A0A1X7SES8_AMPQE
MPLEFLYFFKFYSFFWIAWEHLQIYF